MAILQGIDLYNCGCWPIKSKICRPGHHEGQIGNTWAGVEALVHRHSVVFLLQGNLSLALKVTGMKSKHFRGGKSLEVLFLVPSSDSRT